MVFVFADNALGDVRGETRILVGELLLFRPLAGIVRRQYICAGGGAAAEECCYY